MPTEKECVLRERKAFVAGSIDREQKRVLGYADAHKTAETRYPLTTATRPRLVQFPGGRPSELLRVANGRVEYTACGPGENGGWIAAMPHVIGANLDKKWQSPGLLRVIADLIENPTEEVEDA